MTIFVAASRAKKLKKLRNLASNIINEYGYCYFIRVAFYEFRRQKFKLFFPDPENKITLEQTMHIDEVRKYEKFMRIIPPALLRQNKTTLRHIFP